MDPVDHLQARCTAAARMTAMAAVGMKARASARTIEAAQRQWEVAANSRRWCVSGWWPVAMAAEMTAAEAVPKMAEAIAVMVVAAVAGWWRGGDIRATW